MTNPHATGPTRQSCIYLKGDDLSTVYAPTYKEFRTWALDQGWTPEELAEFTQADDPKATAERILVHLAGTR
jgi:hypothetical protein